MPVIALRDALAGCGCDVVACDLREAPRNPGRVRIAPWGDVHSRSGDFRLTDESVELMRAGMAGHGVDLPIDYEHQTLGGQFAAPDGKAPAAGWISHLDGVPGRGLFADVSWTPRGAREVYTKAYRYLSPVVLVRKADRVAIGLHSVALTNRPAIDNAEPIVNREPIPAAKTSAQTRPKPAAPMRRASLEEVPAELILCEIGLNDRSDRKPLLFDATSMAMCLLRLPKSGVLVDEEHGLCSDLEIAHTGVPRWHGTIGRLSLRGTSESGLVVAHVDWQPSGREAIKAGRLRFLSPCFHTIENHVIGLDSVALTNTPALKLQKYIPLLAQRRTLPA